MTARERGERPAGQGTRRPSNTLEGSSHPARVSPAPHTRHVPPGRRSPSARPPAAPGPGGGRPLLRSPVASSWPGCPSSSTAHREGNAGRRGNPCLRAPGAQGSEAGAGEPGCGPSVGDRTAVCVSSSWAGRARPALRKDQRVWRLSKPLPRGRGRGDVTPLTVTPRPGSPKATNTCFLALGDLLTQSHRTVKIGHRKDRRTSVPGPTSSIPPPGAGGWGPP